MNTAAIRVWESRQTSSRTTSHNRSRRQRRGKRRPGPRRGTSNPDSSVPSPNHQVQDSRQIRSGSTTGSVSRPASESSRVGNSQHRSLGISGVPRVLVQISQHRDFDKDLYVTYQSSSSTQATQSAAQQSLSSSCGPTWGTVTSSLGIGESSGIVPDSQSLPGSSSYVPTASTSRDLNITNSLDPTSSVRNQERTPAAASDAGLVSPVRVVSNNSIEDFSGIVVLASQPSTESSQRRKSAPPPSSADTSSLLLLGDQPPSLPRSASDPATNCRLDRQVQDKDSFITRFANTRRRVNRVIQDSSQSLSSSQAKDSGSPLQLVEIQVPGSIEQRSFKSVRVDPESAESSLVFQTQVPLESLSHSQSQRFLPRSNRSISQILGDTHPSTGSSNTQDNEISAVARRSEHFAQRRSSRAEIFEISEDLADIDRPSQATTTDDSVLSVRDPNSQSLQPLSNDHKADNSPEKKKTNKDHTDFSSSLSARDFPITLDSLEPPQPPPEFYDEMSNMSPDGGNLGRASPVLGTREKLRRMREANAARSQLSKPPSIPLSPSLSMERRPSQISIGPTSPVPFRDNQQQPSSPAARPSPILAQEGGQQSQMTVVPSSSPLVREQPQLQVQPPGFELSRAGTNTPDIIPDKPVYQVQEEPERLEVQPVLISTELPLPLRSSQSVPHTPVTPSRLAVHKEVSPSQTITLEPRCTGKAEFIVPLCMQKRILRQYIDTIEYYPASLKQNMTEEHLSEGHAQKLNELLGRLANVANHIGLEGGGPGSQDTVLSEQEALYAEMSSEKFKFLGHLFEVARKENLHVALIARSGPLHDIIETFLKGKKVRYNRPDTFSRSDPRTAHGQLQVSVIASGKEGDAGVTVARKADLVIGLDETFNANDNQVVDLRTSNNSIGQIAPVIRLVVYSSVEHLDLCLPRMLEPVDRLRKLIFCVWHTQTIVGELEADEPDSIFCAEQVAKFLRNGSQAGSWTIPSIRPIENIPNNMDSDSSLSDALSDVSTEIGRPHEHSQKYWPNYTTPPKPVNVNKATSQSGKRPFVSIQARLTDSNSTC